MSEVVPANKKKLAIIDGKSVFYRGYYAMPNLSKADGTPTGGVFGFAVMALEVIKRLKPDYVAVAWDKPKTNIRKRLEMYPEYKAGRKPSPPDFAVQIPLLHELLQAFGWPLYELDDYEADDIMGTLAVQAAKQDIETMLITSDLDMLQLVDPHIHVFALKKGLSNIELFSPKSFEAKYGIKATQFLDMKALKGDSSDNIPGVPGIGEKGAIELLKVHKTLDGVYENIDLIKESTRKKLVAGKTSAYLSKKLAAIWTDAPIKLNLEEVDGSKCEPLKVRDQLQKLEFRTLVRQLPDAMQVPVEARSTVYSPQSTVLGKAKNIVVDSNGKMLELANDLKKSEQLIIYSRAADKHGKRPQLLILSPSPGRVFTIVLEKITLRHVYEVLKPLFEDEKIKKIGHDIKSTIQVGIELGFDSRGVAHDTQLAAFLLNPLRKDLGLSELATAELGYEGASFEEGDNDELTARAPDIVGAIASLADAQIKELKKAPRLAKVAKTIDFPVIPVIAAMEYEGIQLDAGQLVKMSEQLADLISDLEQQIYGYADEEFNISSPGQLAEILFTKLKLSAQGIKRGKTAYSTAASELDKLRGLHPIIDLITNYREVTKLKNTYVDTLPNMVDDKSRVHTTFAMTVAQTGRLSSHDPNLQNIPVKTELGKEIRAAFVAGSGNMLVSADYSQFELRIAAYLSNDERLIDMFNRDVDVHLATAAEVYGRAPEDVTKNMRREAKVLNFGVMYGLGPHGMVQQTSLNYEQAKHFIQKYFEVRPKLLEYIETVKKQAVEQGYVETIFGRRRPTPDVKSTNFMVREAGIRAAVNMPFQGSAADIMKLAMVHIGQKLEGSPCKMLLQIHDSILVECPESEAENTAKLLKETMENAHKLPVKLTVDTSIGKNWGEL